MQHIKQFFAIAVLISSLAIMHSTLNAECGSGCICVIDRAEYKALEDRICRLESLLVCNDVVEEDECEDECNDVVEEDEYEDELGKRVVVVDEIENFTVGLKKLRKEVINKFNRMRKSLKAHGVDIKKVKKGFNVLYAGIGSPDDLGDIGGDKATVYALIASFDARIKYLEKQLIVSNQN